MLSHDGPYGQERSLERLTEITGVNITKGVAIGLFGPRSGSKRSEKMKERP